MAATNYFKCTGDYFFFDEREYASISAAFAAARAAQDASTAVGRPGAHPPPISAWQRPRLAGPWDACGEVGESSRSIEEWS